MSQFLSIPYNNPEAYGLLNGGITSSTTSVTLQTGQGANFPTIPTGYQLRGTFTDTGEICFVTAISGDVLTMTRGQETAYGAPAAASHSTGTRFEMRVTAGSLAEVQPGVGWYLDTNTWTYASASTFTISGIDYTSVLPIGTKISLVQSSSTKYFTVVSVSFSTNTTVTVTGGGTYTIANSTISNPAYSYTSSLVNFPHSLLNPFVFRAWRNGSFSYVTGDNIIIMDSITYDPSSGFSTSTGEYTVQITGYYFVTSRCEAASSSNILVSKLFLNGTVVADGGYTQPSSAGTASGCSDVIYCSVGDTIAGGAYNSGTPSATVGTQACYLSGYLIN